MTARAQGDAEALDRLGAALRERGAAEARVALVLGSGLGAFAEALEDPRVLPFVEAPGMPPSAVPGHAGRFVLGSCAGVPVLVQEGRVHLYEGHGSRAVTRSVRAFARLGIPALLLTNAAGCLRPEWPVPALMRIEDHLDLQGRAPLARGEAARGRAYDREAGAALDAAAARAGVILRRGVYAGLLGPSYETPAEIRMLGAMGADAVGMSTVAEAAVAARAGLRVTAVSCLANLAAGLAPPGVAPRRLAHEEVVAAGRAMAEDLVALLRAAVPALAG